MSRSVQVVWWVGLAGALLATLVILKAVALVLRALRDIHSLAAITRDAARGIARNLEPISSLPTLGEPARQLREAARTIAAAATSLERKAGALVAAPSGRGD